MEDLGPPTINIATRPVQDAIGLAILILEFGRLRIYDTQAPTL